MSRVLLVLALAGCSDYDLNPKPTEPPDPPTAAPVAIAGPASEARRGEEAQLWGKDSYDPDDDDAELLYEWSVAEAPEGATFAISNPKGGKPTFVADTLGTYVIALQVTDEDGLDSENPAAQVVEVVPWEDLEVTLTWDQDVDLDVHLVAPEGVYYQDSDCFFGNPAPDWGTEGDGTDNPALSEDDDGSGGPEVITYPRPEEGVYTVIVTYWNDRGLKVPTTPTLQVRAEGQQIAVLTGPQLTVEHRAWIAGTLDWGTLTWVDDGTVTTNSALGGPTYNE